MYPCVHMDTTIITKGKAVNLRGSKGGMGSVRRRDYRRIWRKGRERGKLRNCFYLINLKKVGFCSTRIKGSMDIAWMYNQPFLLVQTMSTRSLAKQMSPAQKTQVQTTSPTVFCVLNFFCQQLCGYITLETITLVAPFLYYVLSQNGKATCLSGTATTVFSYWLKTCAISLVTFYRLIKTRAVSLVTFCRLINYVFHCHDKMPTEVAPEKKGGFILTCSQPELESMVAGGSSGQSHGVHNQEEESKGCWY